MGVCFSLGQADYKQYSGRSQLEINSLLQSDAGMYTCMVTNIADTATRSVRLEVRGEGIY